MWVDNVGFDQSVWLTAVSPRQHKQTTQQSSGSKGAFRQAITATSSAVSNVNTVDWKSLSSYAHAYSVCCCQSSWWWLKLFPACCMTIETSETTVPWAKHLLISSGETSLATQSPLTSFFWSLQSFQSSSADGIFSVVTAQLTCKLSSCYDLIHNT